MNKRVIPLNQRKLLLQQTIHTFFSCLGDNQNLISLVLQKFKDLRKEHIQSVKNDLFLWLLESKDKLPKGQSEWLFLLDRLISSFRSDQEKSYHFLEEGIAKNILDKIGRDCLVKRVGLLSSMAEELEKVLEERKELQAELKQTKDALAKNIQECQKLSEEKAKLQDDNQRLSQNIQSQDDMQTAIQDYETMIQDIRQELEGKKNFDLWRLKIFYNKIASITNSTWEYPGVPKSDPFQPKSMSVQKFLASLNNNLP